MNIAPTGHQQNALMTLFNRIYNNINIFLMDDELLRLNIHWGSNQKLCKQYVVNKYWYVIKPSINLCNGKLWFDRFHKCWKSITGFTEIKNNMFDYNTLELTKPSFKVSWKSSEPESEINRWCKNQIRIRPFRFENYFYQLGF